MTPTGPLSGDRGHAASGTEAFDAGDIVLYPGASGPFYQVRAGLIRLHAVDDAGYGMTLRYLKPGDYLGEEALTGRQRRYFAEAVTNSTLTPLDVASLDRNELLELSISLAVCTENLSQALLRLAGKPLRARIAAVLVDLADSAIASRTGRGESVVNLTHDDLAAAVGAVRETVTKTVGELVRLGAIRTGYGKLILVDRQRLARLAST